MSDPIWGDTLSAGDRIEDMGARLRSHILQVDVQDTDGRFPKARLKLNLSITVGARQVKDGGIDRHRSAIGRAVSAAGSDCGCRTKGPGSLHSATSRRFSSIRPEAATVAAAMSACHP
jgi:hypothetical protein